MSTPTLREADFSLPGLLRQLGDVHPGPLPWVSVPVAHNTWARFASDGILTGVEVVLHHTVIARFVRTEHEDAPALWHLTVNTGGWDTVTTRDRLQRILRPLGLAIYRHRKFGTVIDGVLVDGRSTTRALALHDGHRLAVATVLEDGARVVPPTLTPALGLDFLVHHAHVPVVSLLAAAPAA